MMLTLGPADRTLLPLLLAYTLNANAALSSALAAQMLILLLTAETGSGTTAASPTTGKCHVSAKMKHLTNPQCLHGLHCRVLLPQQQHK
jgi:hypothetical protein